MRRLSKKHKSVQVRVVLPENLVEALDKMAGIAPRSAYIRSLIERAWEEHERQREGRGNDS